MALSKKNIIPLAFGMAFLVTACNGQKTTDVEISSAPVSLSGATSAMLASPSTSSTPPLPVIDFSFCIKRVKLEGEDGSPIRREGEIGENGENDVDDISFSPGLITVTNNTVVNWGTLTIPADFKLKKIKVKVKKDPALCNGANYSVKFNDFQTPEDIEFRWSFEPAVTVDGNTHAIQVSLESVVNALRNAINSTDHFNGADLKSHIEHVEGWAEKD